MAAETGDFRLYEQPFEVDRFPQGVRIRWVESRSHRTDTATKEGGMMTKILIPYGTTEGQTAKIAEVIADVIRGHGDNVEAVDIRDAPDRIPDAYDAVIIGAPIHMGRHDKRVVKFVQQNRDLLDRLPSAFFSVSLAAHGDTEEAEGYVGRFEQQTGWRPATIALFSGALLYTHYGFVKRHIMKKIAHDKPGHLGTDLSRDYVYTEWDGVKQFAEDFLTDLVADANRPTD